MKPIAAIVMLILAPALTNAQVDAWRDEIPQPGKRTLDIEGSIAITYPQAEARRTEGTFRYVAHDAFSVFKVSTGEATVLAYEDRPNADTGYWTSGKSLFFEHTEQRFSPRTVSFFPHAPQWIISNVEGLAERGRWTRSSRVGDAMTEIISWDTPIGAERPDAKRAVELHVSSDGRWSRLIASITDGENSITTEEFTFGEPLEGFISIPKTWTTTLNDSAGSPIARIEGTIHDVKTIPLTVQNMDRTLATLSEHGMKVTHFGSMIPLEEIAEPESSVTPVDFEARPKRSGRLNGAIIGAIVGAVLTIIIAQRRRMSRP